jgi:Asparagine synthase (glutamine-hydrolyzing)
LNKDLINEYLFYKYISGTKTLIKNIYQLEPGVICSIDLKNKNIKLNKKQYYYFKEEDNRDSIPEAVNKTKNLLEKSINLQLQCDANLGIQLSGGIDSTVIAEMANRKKNINYSYLNSFDNYELDESNYADKVSKKLSISLKKIKIDKKYFFKNLLKAIYFLDEPLNHPHSVAMLKISEIAKKNVSVVLAGEGADEIFYGYERYKTLNWNSDINKIIKNAEVSRKNSDLNKLKILQSFI